MSRRAGSCIHLAMIGRAVRRMPGSWVLVAALAACQGGAPDERPAQSAGEVGSEARSEAASEAVSETAVAGEAGRPGTRFDPGAVAPGDSVGALVVDSIVARTTAVDSTLVGTARFRGEIALTGRTMHHPDEDARRTTLCFEADAASAARLPRWRGDERRPWFCFANQAEAQEALGPPSDGVLADIVVDQFTIHRYFTDAVNSARLVR